jgi:hypothetical protein
MGQLVLALDVYGTLLDTSAVAGALRSHLGLADAVAGKAPQIAASWRKYQLE